MSNKEQTSETQIPVHINKMDVVGKCLIQSSVTVICGCITKDPKFNFPVSILKTTVLRENAQAVLSSVPGRAMEKIRNWL